MAPTFTLISSHSSVYVFVGRFHILFRINFHRTAMPGFSPKVISIYL